MSSILDGPGANSPTPAQQLAAPAATVLDGPSSAAQPSTGGGFLNDLGINWNDVPTDNSPSDGTHRCFVTKSEIRTKKDQTKSWVFTYRVADGESEQGRTKDEWRPLPNTNGGHFLTEKDETNARWLKQRLISLGVPEDRVGSVSPGDILGTEVYVTLKTTSNSQGTFQNVTNVKLASEVPTGAISAPQNQGVQGLI